MGRAEEANGIDEAGMIHPGEQMGGMPADCKACRGCLFAHGPAPFEDAPDKVYCLIYRRGESTGKPSVILFDGAPCEHFSPDDEPQL